MSRSSPVATVRPEPDRPESAPPGSDSFRDWDQRLGGLIWWHRTPALVTAARVVGAAGDPVVVALATAVAALGSARPPRRVDPVPIIAVATGALARHLACRLIARPRPPAPVRLVPTSGPSFPSKHTTLAVLAAGALVRTRPVAGRRWPVPVLAGTAVAAARVTVGAHWPTDVAAGLAAGLAWWAVIDHLTGRTS